jgi:hypothetical protein
MVAASGLDARYEDTIVTRVCVYVLHSPVYLNRNDSEVVDFNEMFNNGARER